MAVYWISLKRSCQLELTTRIRASHVSDTARLTSTLIEGHLNDSTEPHQRVYSGEQIARKHTVTNFGIWRCLSATVTLQRLRLWQLHAAAFTLDTSSRCLLLSCDNSLFFNAVNNKVLSLGYSQAHFRLKGLGTCSHVCSPSRFYHSSTLALAGHNKWSKIKHKKKASDLEKSKTVHKVISLIISAIKTGGGADPNSNIRLASILDVAKKAGTSTAHVQRIMYTLGHYKLHNIFPSTACMPD